MIESKTYSNNTMENVFTLMFVLKVKWRLND